MIGYGENGGTGGWSTLGAALGGTMSGNLQQNAFQRGALMGTEQANLLQVARKNRDQNLAREAITPDVVQKAASGDPASQALVSAAAAQAGINPQELAQASRTNQLTGWGAQEWQAANAANPDLNLVNRQLMVSNGKPVDLTKVMGGVAINPMQTPDSQVINPTAVGSADIMLKGAQAGAANAAAGEHNAMAARATAGIGTDKLRVVDGPTGPMVVNLRDAMSAQPITTPDGKPIGNKMANGTMTAPTEAEFQAIGATNPMTGRVDPIKAQAFMAWKDQQSATDPRMGNTAYALQKFAALQRSPVGTPGAAPAANANPIVVPPGGIGAAMAGAPAAPPPGMAGAVQAIAPGGMAPAAPAAPTAAAPPSPIKGVSRASNGAYLPTTQQQYDALPPGSVYIRPGETTPRTKGGK